MSPAVLFLSDQVLLNQYLQGCLPTPETNRQRIFQAVREQQPFQPDYAIESRIHEELAETATASSSGYAHQVLQALHLLTQPLWLRGQKIYVKEKAFELWQQRLTRVMPLTLISFFALRKLNDEQQAKTRFKEWFENNSCLPSPYLPELEGLAQQGLTEHHLHIMGTTESDNVWQHALCRPKHYLVNLTKADGNINAKQQLQQVNPQLEFGDLYRLLRLASQLRTELIKLIQGKSQLTPVKFREICTHKLIESFSKHPASEYTQSSNQLVNEAILLYATYQHLAFTNCEITARCLHLYLLLQSLFHQLLNQQLLDKGFQQFEKITQNEVREEVESKFKQRFNQLQGMYNRRLYQLEARFAPKNSTAKLRKLLYSINKGYKSSGLHTQLQLTLTAHFIKKKDKPGELQPCRHYSLRQSLHKQQLILCHYLKKKPECAERVISIDAAGNELDAGPEVFAPLYRKLRQQGFKHFTYHAGEDFKHLLSGMRQVYEAMAFLDLKPGDRIGHATAIGIEPYIWLDRSAPSVQIERGEWLDTLLFTHHLLMLIDDSRAINQAYQLEEKLLDLAEAIFATGGLSLAALKTAWLSRGSDPINFQKSEELSRNTRNLLTVWHRPETYERAKKLCSVKSNLLSAQLMRQLQDKIICLLNERQIAIESLPTSNLRISYYKSYSEHHLHRWMNTDEPVRPCVILGSDDPGIFSTNIYNEYAHILLSMRQNNPEQPSKALDSIKELFENGRNYGFRPE